jgi:hypothetical protein
MIGLGEDALALWIYNHRLLKSDQTCTAAGGRFVAATEPDMVALWAAIQRATRYWNLL